MPYSAPLAAIENALKYIADIDAAGETGAFENYDSELIAPVLEEANKIASGVLSPLNPIGHQKGSTLKDGEVTSAPGFADAYKTFSEGGWIGLPFPEEFGGQALPKSLAIAVMEMMQSANPSFSLNPMLTFGAIEALLIKGTDEQKSTYLEKLISGEWTGAMNLTEPSAGSDVGALKSKAIPNGDGSFAITGQKIFITWGEHDVADNIIQLVLARTPDAPAGSRGVSLFLVPKFFVNEDGSLGDRNSYQCIGLEEKIGIHASPTCVMEYDGAKGWLIGDENKGLAAMFIMMNAARLQVGLQGVAACEAAMQSADAYARDRKQGKAQGVNGDAAIIHHPDIQRTLVTMAANAQAARALVYACAGASDLAEHSQDDVAKAKFKQREDLLVPLAKAWSTDRGCEMAHQSVQVFGGMGFMNEAESAQIMLDARIYPIYEGTNGIQALDLVGRKLSADKGEGMIAMIAEIRETVSNASSTGNGHLAIIANRLYTAVGALEEATDWMLTNMAANDKSTALAGATAYLRLAGDVIGGSLLTKAAISSLEADDSFKDNAVTLARVFAEDTLTQAEGRMEAVSAPANLVEDAMSTLFEAVEA
ncbi:acyl-CoA dehydrogenase [Hirschia maritima]|uniref:acyl-CoA dehydrogenase n=1 Tax=Hirschia maritima TaxID=1121961 RepID=UPI000364F9A2|nr:acyl-CoA dehydrogenase [Hirschia maritima]